MSERDDKPFDPTKRRIEKAREEGNVFQSKEVMSVGMLATSAVLLIIGLPIMFETLEALMRDLYQGASRTNITPDTATPLLREAGARVGVVLMPFFLILIVMALGLSFLQTGGNLTFKPLMPKWERISPLKGLQRIFSKKGLFELFKAIAKIVVAGPMAYVVISRNLSDLLLLHTLPLPIILEEATGWIVTILLYMVAALIVLALLDFAFEKYKYKEDLKMSKRELEDEKKEQEGDPQMQNKRREKARELAHRPRMDHAVMKSDAVVTNPTHYSVALRYEPTEAAAPRVMLKGIRKRALTIRELAREHDVPIVEDPPLARALYSNVEEEEEIPEELYQAVAAILAEIYRDRGSQL